MDGGDGGGGGVAPKVNIYSFATQSASCLPSNYGLHENVQEELCKTTRISSLVVLCIQILLVFLLQQERGGGGVYKTPGDSLTALQAYNLCKDVN